MISPYSYIYFTCVYFIRIEVSSVTILNYLSQLFLFLLRSCVPFVFVVVDAVVQCDVCIAVTATLSAHDADVLHCIQCCVYIDGARSDSHTSQPIKIKEAKGSEHRTL